MASDYVTQLSTKIFDFHHCGNGHMTPSSGNTQVWKHSAKPG